jgi:LytS/YehU family sensor histidine kinase
VPPLLLQPLVENAVTHGIAHVVEGGVVRIEARRLDGRLEIAIENPLDPEAPRRPAHGLGLDNVRRRLSALYGSDATLAVRKGAASFRVEVSLPASGGS